MTSWPSRGDNNDGYHSYDNINPAYANVPSTPSLQDPLQPPVRSPLSSNSTRSNYVSSPLNPNSTGSKSRPVSWGGSGGLDKIIADSTVNNRAGGSSGSEGSSNSGERDYVTKGVVAGTVGASLGPYAPIRPAYAEPKGGSHHRFSTISSVGSVVSFSDSKYPVLYGGTNSSHLGNNFLPYTDNPHLDYVAGGQLPDDDDALHDPNPRGYKEGMAPLNWRGVLNVLLVFVIIGALVALFAGYPVVSYFASGESWYGNSVGINATGQAADLPNMPQLIDPQTPDYAKTRKGFDGYDYELVFSDEFNIDGRTFYEGDDPFWEAVDLNYWATKDYEWYDPSAVTTANGALVITLDSIPNHDLWYRSGMLQSWNKFCFTGGYVEVATVFPGDQLAQGFWPAAWTMGNLGRPGYGATTDGMWPYTYDSCDVGTLANQTGPNGPDTSTLGKAGGPLSFLPGQRASACTCSGEDHPGPVHSKGRGSPEIDIFEAERSKTGGPGGQTSQSSQFAPFNNQYQPNTADRTLYTPDRTVFNTFLGSPQQQALSSLTDMDSSVFQNSQQNFSVYGVEFYGDTNNRPAGFITWVAAGTPSAGMTAAAAGPDASVQIGQRLVSEEPMGLVLNLGLSKSFQSVNLETLQFPAKLFFDYVRVYQRKGQTNVGCDPKDYPTADYINKHLNAYTNPNLTSWASAGYTYPKNSILVGDPNC